QATEKPPPPPPGEHPRNLPAKIARVSEAGVQSEPGGRMIEVSRIAGEENAALPVAVGDHIARHPTPDRKDLVRYVLANRLAEKPFGVDLIRGVVILPAREAEAIKLAAVETDEIGPQPLRVDESDQGSLAHRVMIPQLRPANENAEKVADIRRSIHLNAQPRPDHAAAAAAIDKVGCGDLKPLVVRAVVHGRDNMAARVADRLQTTTVAEFDLVEAPGELRQDGIEKKLIAALRAFRALLDRLTAAMGGAFDASDLVTAERRAIEDRVREV